MRRPFLATAVVFLLAVAACGARQPSASDTSPSVPSAPTVSSSSPSPKAPGRHRTESARPAPGAGSSAVSPAGSPAAATVTKLLVFVVENHSLTQMRSQMPFTHALAERFGYADRYHAITHPSLPNYLAIAGGDTFGVHDDDSPAAHPLRGGSVFGTAVRHGSTARLYAEAMQRPCQSEPAGTYAVKHNPWAYFTDEAALCRHGDVPLRQFSDDVTRGRLPAVGMVIPDLCDDAHDCSLGDADVWLRSYVGRAMQGADWKSGHLAIVITADEDDRAHGNQILTVVADPALHHVVVSTPLDHFALSRAYADVAGIPALRHAGGAVDLLQAFGLAPG